jgi:hypothetical protein
MHFKLFKWRWHANLIRWGAALPAAVDALVLMVDGSHGAVESSNLKDTSGFLSSSHRVRLLVTVNLWFSTVVWGVQVFYLLRNFVLAVRSLSGEIPLVGRLARVITLGLPLPQRR